MKQLKNLASIGGYCFRFGCPSDAIWAMANCKESFQTASTLLAAKIRRSAIMSSSSLVSTVVKPGLVQAGLCRFYEAGYSLFRRNLCILQRVDAPNPLICPISRNGVMSCMRKHREYLCHFTTSRQDITSILLWLHCFRIDFGMVEALATARRLRNVLNGNHGAKWSGACTYVFIVYSMFRFPGNDAALI